MLRFILSWIVVLIVVDIYLKKKRIDIGFNNDIVAIVLSFSIVGFLTFIQWIFQSILNLFI